MSETNHVQSLLFSLWLDSIICYNSRTEDGSTFVLVWQSIYIIFQKRETDKILSFLTSEHPVDAEN